MPKPVRRIADGFLFGLGFGLALVLVAVLAAGIGGALVFHQARTSLPSLLHTVDDPTTADGVTVITTNVIRESSVLVVTAQITNATTVNYSNLQVAIEVFDPDGQSLDWRMEPLGTLSPHSHTNFSTVFQPSSPALMTKDPSFKFAFIEMRRY